MTGLQIRKDLMALEQALNNANQSDPTWTSPGKLPIPTFMHIPVCFI